MMMTVIIRSPAACYSKARYCPYNLGSSAKHAELNPDSITAWRQVGVVV